MEPYLGQLLLIPWDWAPLGWARCDGSLLSIQGNESLFALIGVTFGGDGVNNFKLPDLRGRVPVSVGAMPGGQTYVLAEAQGCERVGLSIDQLPAHIHSFATGSVAADTKTPAGNMLADAAVYYDSAASPVALNSATCTSVGGTDSHDNIQPYLVLNWIIATEGIWPERP